jgi:S-adenosylmethionine-dependent methyltransferase
VGEDTWAGLADTFADQAYASVKGLVRTHVMHQQLLEHQPRPPATVLDVGADAAVGGRRFAAVLCHGVLRVPRAAGAACRPAVPVRRSRRRGLDHDGQRKASAERPALERRWDDALAAFDARTEIGVLGVAGRADTVEELNKLIRSRGVEPVR